MSPKVIKCQICGEQPFKYKCSSCQVVYCSVPCYKRHKAESCSILPPPPPSTSGYEGEPASTSQDDEDEAVVAEALDPAVDASAIEPLKDDDERSHNDSASQLPSEEAAPLRALSTLVWPPEPEDGQGEGNPLDRDQPKPLRRDELLAIATSVQLRALLANPLLPPLLARVNALPHGRSYRGSLGKEQYLQMLLGVAPSTVNDGQTVRGGRGGMRGGRGGRGGRGRGGFRNGGPASEAALTSEELQLFRQFALCVEDVLRTVGRERRGLHWESEETGEDGMIFL